MDAGGIMKTVDSVSVKNEYNVERVKRKRRISVLNLLLVQVAICLVVSVSVLAIRALTGSAGVVSANAGAFFDIIGV